MFRRRRFNKRTPWKPRTRINEWIRMSPVRLIDEDGQNLGIVETPKALAMAKEKGLDLIEISPNARPPVCRIMDQGKFKYQQAQDEKKQKTKQKVVKIKGVRIGISTSSHDLETKAKQAGKFLNKGHKVKVEIILRGREKGMFAIAKERLEKFVSLIPEGAKMEQDIKKQPRGLAIIVIKDPTKQTKQSEKADSQAS